MAFHSIIEMQVMQVHVGEPAAALRMPSGNNAHTDISCHALPDDSQLASLITFQFFLTRQDYYEQVCASVQNLISFRINELNHSLHPIIVYFYFFIFNFNMDMMYLNKNQKNVQKVSSKSSHSHFV